MRATVRILTALLLVVSLAWTQSSFTAQLASKPANECACHKCARACCAASPAPVSSEPVAPAPGAQQNDPSLFVATLACIATLPPDAAQQFHTFFLSSSAAATPAPLYQRDCAYLI